MTSTFSGNTAPSTDVLIHKRTRALVTSIPPSKIARSKRVLQAWDACGIDVYSINSAEEGQVLRLHLPSLRVIEATEDYSAIYGRPLVSIGTALKQLSSRMPPDSVIGVVNADIFPNVRHFSDATADEPRAGELLVYKRTDYALHSDGGDVAFSPQAYRHGYDLFLLRNDAKLEALLSDASGDLAFGVPWWDYWFPVKAHVHGYAVRSVETCSIFHERHPEAFSQELWRRKGSEFHAYLSAHGLAEQVARFGRSTADDPLLALCDSAVDFIDAQKFLTRRKELRPKPPGVSIVTACMNRNDNLLRAVRTWLPHREVSEIVVVDWNSTTPVAETLEGMRDPRIRIIRTDLPQRWILSPAFNLGMRSARYDTVLKLDADVTLSQGFFANHPMADGVYYSGSWRTARNDNEKRLNGSFFARANDIAAAGGYNEVIDTYGWDDSDLYNRLDTFLRNAVFDPRHLSHVEQTPESRVSNTKTNLRLKGLPPEIYTELEIRKNEWKAHMLPPRLGLWPDHSGHDTGRAEDDEGFFYRRAIARELAKSFVEGGLGLNEGFLLSLSTEALYTLLKYRVSSYSHRPSTAHAVEGISRLPFEREDLITLLSHPASPFMTHEVPLSSYPGLVKSGSTPPIGASGSFETTADYGLPRADVASPYSSTFYIDEFRMKGRGRRVTVPVVLFNAHEFTAGLLRDIEQQTLFDKSLFVFIVADRSIYFEVEAFCTRWPDNTILITLVDDPGLYGCWNYAIQNTITPYVSNWNADDRRSSEHLRSAVAHLDAHLDISAYCSALFVSREKNRTFLECIRARDETWFEGAPFEFDHRRMFQKAWWMPSPAEQNTITSRNFLHCMPVWRRSMHDAHGYFDEDTFGASADWEFWLRAGAGGARYYCSGKVSGVYYLNPGSYGRTAPMVVSKEQKIIERYSHVASFEDAAPVREEVRRGLTVSPL